jgi:hypothetical protein
MSEEQTGGRSRTHRVAGASAGVPDDAANDRVAELEARIARLEGSPGLRERGRSMMDKVVPPEATHHFRTAAREHLLGIRTIVDFWIKRVDETEADPGRETIQID